MIEIKHFLLMGGYAKYVWSAYLITLSILIANLSFNSYLKKATIKSIKAWWVRHKQC